MLVPLVIIGVAVLLLIIFTLLRRRSRAALRAIEALDRLNRVTGVSVETGTRLHLSLGRGNLMASRSGSALAGLALLRQLAERASISDRPPIVTSGDASITLLSQDTLQAGYKAAGAEDQYRVGTGRLTGLTPFAYAAGTLPVVRDENVSANIVIGDLGVEAALLAEAADRQDAHLIAASENISAQSVLYATVQEPLVGEELFASGAYLGAGAAHEASLQVQDILRWLIILAIGVGAVLKLIGVQF